MASFICWDEENIEQFHDRSPSRTWPLGVLLWGKSALGCKRFKIEDGSWPYTMPQSFVTMVPHPHLPRAPHYRNARVWYDSVFAQNMPHKEYSFVSQTPSFLSSTPTRNGTGYFVHLSCLLNEFFYGNNCQAFFTRFLHHGPQGWCIVDRSQTDKARLFNND